MFRFREWRAGIFFTIRIALVITFGALIVRAEDFSVYRDFRLGSDIVLAQAAISESVRLDVQEAPQREIEKEQARASEERASHSRRPGRLISPGSGPRRTA